MLSLASQKKTYDPNAAGLTGGLGPLASMASGAPGSQVASPSPVKPIMSSGGVPLGAGWSNARAGAGGVVAPAYTTRGDIAAQRGVEAGREAQRNEYLSGAMAAGAPGAWQQAGYGQEYWENERKTQEALLSRRIAAKRAQLNARRRAGSIDAADYDLEMSNLAAQQSSGLTAIRNSIAAQRMEQGQSAAMQQAQLGIAAAGAVPSDRMSPVDTTPKLPNVSAMGGGRGGGSRTELGQEMAAIAQDLAKYGSWDNVPRPIQDAYRQRYPNAGLPAPAQPSTGSFVDASGNTQWYG